MLLYKRLLVNREKYLLKSDIDRALIIRNGAVIYHCINSVTVLVKFSLRDLYRTHFIIYTDIFRAFAILPRIVINALSTGSDTILYPQTDAFVSLHLLWSTCIHGAIRRRIMLLKGVALRRGESAKGRDLSKGMVERSGGKCTSARTRVDLFLGAAWRRAFFRRR